VILWTRLVPRPLDPQGGFGMPDSDIEVRWEVAEDEAFEQVVAAGIAEAQRRHGHSLHVDVQDLEPDAWYHYRFSTGSYTSPVGRARTMPADDTEADQLVIAFASCQNRQSGHYTPYDHLVQDPVDLVFHLGDYVYEYPGGRGDREVPLPRQPETLDEYRHLYGVYKGDAKLQAAHRHAPWVVTWDDHEVQNNYAGLVPDGGEDAAFAERRAAAYQAYWEHQPLRVPPPSSDGRLDLHRSVRFGSLATFFVLDGRQYRTDQVCGDGPTTEADCPELTDEANTMLGAEQESWLEEGLAGSPTTWNVLAQQTVMKALVVGDTVLNVDQWDGYPAARNRLLGAIDDAGVENVVVLTGDIHAAGAADLRLPDAGREGKVVAHELVGTSISSRGLDSLGSVDLTGPLGIPYANFRDRGYCRCTITPERWLAEFVVVDTVEQPTSDARIDAKVAITAGRPGVEVL
jgi:alkaline phosphatase D